MTKKLSNNNFDALSDNNMDRSNINMDITKKLSTHMDFSIVLNKQKPDETNYNEFLMNKTSDFIKDMNSEKIWDISCIENKQLNI